MALPVALGAVGTFIGMALSGIVARVLTSLGMSVVTYVGIVEVTESLIDLVRDSFSGIAGDAIAIMGIAGVDTCLSLILSAYTGVITWVLVSKGFKRLSFAPPGDDS